MNLQRKVRRLNELLRSELGENPLYAWKYSESHELLYPMTVYVEDESVPGGQRQLFDYVCGCGVNKSIHSPHCRTLTRAQPRVTLRPLLDGPDYRNSWVICSRIFPNEVEWEAVYGTVTQYPSGGVWMPVSSGTFTLALQPGRTPDAASTDLMVRMVRESRSTTPEEWERKWLEASERKERKKAEDLHDQVKDILSGSILPGRKEERSYYTPEVLKH